MEFTVILDQHGQIIGAVHGHIDMQPPAPAASGVQAGPVMRSGQSFEHVTVPEDFAEIKSDPDAFVRRLKEHLAHLGKNSAD